MPSKTNTPSTVAESNPTKDDYKNLLHCISQAQALVNSAHEARYRLGQDEQYYREANARYDQARSALEVAYHQLVMAQFQLLFSKIGQIEARLNEIVVNAAGRRI